jgi:cyclopropane-fatty-acyl-phospholipid synthase
VTGGAIGFAESYMDGDWDTPDLAALLTLAAANEQHLRSTLAGTTPGRLLARLVHLTRRNTRRGAARNIARHYDLGNAFYEAWLDPTMTYSSAYFGSGDFDLASAQIAKYRRLARIGRIGPEHHVLEIGCGWGGFAAWAAREIGCRVTGITISPAQQRWAAARIQQEGLADRVSIRLQDYRDVEGHFDRIASIEMIEAVGERYWARFFENAKARLNAGGIAALQVITMDDRYFERYRRGADFIQRYIFPGGMLPSPGALRRHEVAAGFRLLADHGFGNDYARTLEAWRMQFESAWPSIASIGFDDRFRRMWRYYLAYCEAGFRTGRIDVRQIALEPQ